MKHMAVKWAVWFLTCNNRTCVFNRTDATVSSTIYFGFHFPICVLVFRFYTVHLANMATTDAFRRPQPVSVTGGGPLNRTAALCGADKLPRENKAKRSLGGLGQRASLSLANTECLRLLAWPQDRHLDTKKGMKEWWKACGARGDNCFFDGNNLFASVHPNWRLLWWRNSGEEKSLNSH